MKKHALILLMLLIIVACKQDKKIMSDDAVNKLSSGSYKVPSPYGRLDLFVMSDNQDIIVTNTDYLRYVYDYHFVIKFKTYNEFLSKTLNHEITLDKKVFDSIPYESFKISKMIEKQYKDLKFETFFKKYVVKSKYRKDTFVLSDALKIPHDEILTISYYLYLHGYQTKFTDYSPQYVVTKRDKIMSN